MPPSGDAGQITELWSGCVYEAQVEYRAMEITQIAPGGYLR